MLEHAMKVLERIFEYRIWQQVEIDDMQFGFMKGKGTTDAIEKNFFCRLCVCVCISVHCAGCVFCAERSLQQT